MASESFLKSIFIKEAELWLSASETHPFLVGCADSTVSTIQFDTWMVQDFMYVRSFESFFRGIMAIAPAEDEITLKSGKVALDNEIMWFQEKAKDRGLELSVPPLSTTSAYKEFMTTMSQENYSYQAVALYLIERVYQRAWNVVLEKAGEDGLYSIYAKNWGNSDFKGYVDLLEGIAEREAATANVTNDEISFLFDKVMKLEVNFWDMAYQSKQ